MAEITRTAEADSITATDLAELAAVTGRAVSIYMPTARGGAEVRENAIRAKALIKDAEAGLKANGATEDEATEILAPLVALLADDDYWQYLADGLALYAAPGFWRAFRLTIDFPEVTHVGDRLAVLPVVSAAMHQDDFLLLALSQNKVRLFEGTFSTMREVELGTIPASLEEIEGETTPPPHQQQHFAGGGGVMHSHGTGAEVGAYRSRNSCARSRTGSPSRSNPTTAGPWWWPPWPRTCPRYATISTTRTCSTRWSPAIRTPPGRTNCTSGRGRSFTRRCGHGPRRRPNGSATRWAPGVLLPAAVPISCSPPARAGSTPCCSPDAAAPPTMGPTTSTRRSVTSWRRPAQCSS